MVTVSIHLYKMANSSLLVRTHRGALLTGAIVAAFAATLTAQTGLTATPRAQPTLDAWVLLALTCGAIFGGIFVLAHGFLRKRNIRSRIMYALVGALAAVPPFTLALGLASVRDAVANGRLSGLLITPLIVGALLGFLYHRSAGYDPDGDEPDALASAVASGTTDSTTTVTVGDTEYYDGPLIVKTSLGAMGLAAFLAGAIYVLPSTFINIADPFPLQTQFEQHYGGAQRIALGGMVGIAILGLLPMAVAHAVCRAKGATSYSSYAFAGAAAPLLVVLPLSLIPSNTFFLIVGLQFLVPSVLAMIFYRKLAGLEPAPLPEDIDVSDRRALVGKDHIRRRTARVVDNSK